MKTQPILTNESRTPETAATWMLVVLAGVCVFGVIWALGHEARPKRNGPAVVQNPPEAEVSPEQLESQILQNLVHEQPAPVVGVAPEVLPTTHPAPESVAPAVPAMAATVPSQPVAPPPLPAIAPPVQPAPALPASVPSPKSPNGSVHPLLFEAVSIARHLRNKGDTQSALETLRAADLQVPNQPVLLAEFGQTYEAMLLPAKAEAYWKRLLKMGEAVAGEHYELAKQHLEAPETPAPQVEVAMPLSLGTCQIVKDPTVENGEKVTVRLSILAKPGAVINPAQMDIHVFLFEQVNDGERIEQARAEAPEQAWVSAPVDWSQPDGETIEITYNLPAPTEEELRDLGKRSFHGYMVKLFYQNKLVGEQAEPLSLLEFTKQPAATTPGALDGILFPK